jgi:hypothetical protein
MKLSFEQALTEVWRQALVENAKVVELGTERYPVRLTSKHRLRQVDFVFEGHEIRGLEQNPETKSRWAQMARAGKKLMQFLSEGRYVANVGGTPDAVLDFGLQIEPLDVVGFRYRGRLPQTIVETHENHHPPHLRQTAET